MDADAYPPLGQVAVEAGILSTSELDDALQKAGQRGVPLGEMLFKLGYLSRDRLLQLLADQYRTQVYDLNQWEPDQRLLDVLPATFVQEYDILPIRMEDGQLTLAAAGPFHTPVADLLRRVEERTQMRATLVICDADGLRRVINEFYTGVPGRRDVETLPDFATLMGEIRADAEVEATHPAEAPAELDDLLDLAFTTLLEVRAHPFMVAVIGNTNSAAELLDKAKQYQRTGKFAEALTVARRAHSQLTASLRKAEEVQQAWGPLLRHVELLRTRITQLDGEGAGDYAPQELGRLREIRDAMLGYVESKEVERLRPLVDEAQTLVEQVASLSPQRGRREQLVERLVHVREVLARVRKLGAQAAASTAVEEAYRLLEQADAQAKDGVWDQVQDTLAQALAHAEAAEAQAQAEAERRRIAQGSLRDLVTRTAAALDELFAHPAAGTVAPALHAAARAVADARAALQGDGDLTDTVARLTVLDESELPALRVELDAAGQRLEALHQRTEQVARAVRESAGTHLPGPVADAAVRLAEQFQAFELALAARNLDETERVLERAEAEVRDVVDTHRTALAEHRRVEVDLARAAAALDALASHPAVAAKQDTVDLIREDLDRAGAALADANWGDAAALVEHATQALDGTLRPAVAEHDGQLRGLLERLSTLPSRFAALGAEVGPDALAELDARVTEAVEALGRADLAGADAALAEADARADALARDADTAATRRREELDRRTAEVEGLLEGTVSAHASQATPELLEEAYFDLNAARSLLGESGARLAAADAERIAQHLRAAELTAQHVTALGSREGSRVGAALEELHAMAQGLSTELDALREGPALGFDTAPLEVAADALAEAAGAEAREDLARGYALLRQVERQLEQVREQRETAHRQQAELETFFAVTLPEHLAALDGELLQGVAPETWAELQAAPEAAREALETQDFARLLTLRDAAAERLTECGATERSERSRRLVEIHQLRADAHGAVRLARLLGADTQSADLLAAATQLLAVADEHVQARRWDTARTDFTDAVARARQAQEAAFQGTRHALQAHDDLIRAALEHLAGGNAAAAREALEAATRAAGRARAPEAVLGAAQPAAELDSPTGQF